MIDIKLWSYVLIYGIFLLTNGAFCQGISIRGGISTGYAVQHAESVMFHVDGPAFLLTFAADIDTKDYFYWADNLNNPTLSIETNYLNYNSKELGYSIGLAPSIYFPFVRQEQFSIGLRISSGISVHSRIYNKISNPYNNAISSRINNVTKLLIETSYKISDKSKIYFIGGLIHSSNGATKTPNLGVNVFDAGLYYSRNIIPLEAKTQFVNTYDSHPIKLLLGGILTTRQGKIPNGPDYYYFDGGLTGLYELNKLNYLGVGFSIGLSEEDVDYLLRIKKASTRPEAHQLARRYEFHMQYELLLGDIGINLASGVYVWTKYKPSAWFTKLLFRYYFMPRNGFFRPFVGVELKSHLLVAEYVALKLGICLQV